MRRELKIIDLDTNEVLNWLKGRLTTIEWIGIEGRKYCPACKEEKSNGHDQNCWLGKVLGRCREVKTVKIIDKGSKYFGQKLEGTIRELLLLS